MEKRQVDGLLAPFVVGLVPRHVTLIVTQRVRTRTRMLMAHAQDSPTRVMCDDYWRGDRLARPQNSIIATFLLHRVLECLHAQLSVGLCATVRGEMVVYVLRTFVDYMCIGRDAEGRQGGRRARAGRAYCLASLAREPREGAGQRESETGHEVNRPRDCESDQERRQGGLVGRINDQCQRRNIS